MLSIRFTRIGRKKLPIYRIVVMDKRRDPWGKYLEKLGFYNPRTKETKLETERINYWLGVGAQASETVHNLLVKGGIIQDDKKKKSVKITKRRSEKINREKTDKEKAEADKKAKVEAEKLAAQEAAKAEAEAKVLAEAEAAKTVETEVKEEVKEETPVETPTEEAPKTE